MAKITRIDYAKSFTTVFKFEDGDNGAYFWVPIDQADDYQTEIENSSWSALNNLWNLSGKTVIKES